MSMKLIAGIILVICDIIAFIAMCIYDFKTGQYKKDFFGWFLDSIEVLELLFALLLVGAILIVLE